MKTHDFPTTQTVEVFAFIKEANPGSFSALLPVFLVIPNAVNNVFSFLGD